MDWLPVMFTVRLPSGCDAFLCSCMVLSLAETVSGLRRTLARHLQEPACKQRVQNIMHELNIRGKLHPGRLSLVYDNGSVNGSRTLFGHYNFVHYMQFIDIEQQVALHGHLVLQVCLRSKKNALKMRWLMRQGPLTLPPAGDTGRFSDLDHWDGEMIARLVMRNPANYRLLPIKFKMCPDIAMVVLAKNGLALIEMPEALRANKPVVLVAVAQNRQAFGMASEQLRLDPEVLEKASTDP